MTLSPDADKAQVRQAVIELQYRMSLAEGNMGVASDVHNLLVERLEEAERRIELLSNALKSTLTSRPEPKPEPRPQWSAEPTVPQRDWRPVNEGKYWMPPVGNMVSASEVPPDVLERFQREKGTPTPEYPPDEA